MISEYDLHLRLAPRQEAALANISQWLDAERLLHLHPHWFVETLTEENGAWLAEIRDYATERVFALCFTVSFHDSDVMRLEFSQGPYKILRFFCKEHGLHVKAQWREEAGKTVFSQERDVELQLWLRSVREYLRLYLKDTLRAKLSRKFMNRVLLKMNPSQRKICLMMFKITVVEILLIIGIIVVFVLTVR